MELKPGKFSGVLVYLVDNKTERVWLARKKRKIGAGLFNGYGGGIEPNENARQAAVRELFAESGVFAWPKDLKHVGTVIFHNQLADGECVVDVPVFVLNQWRKDPIETEEMDEPESFPLHYLPRDEMMIGDHCFLPAALCKDFDQKFLVEIFYNSDQTEFVKQTQYGALPKTMWL